ncbi:MAG: T9SS type A sorting domain-containing protein [Saprospiraceae bacterium]
MKLKTSLILLFISSLSPTGFSQDCELPSATYILDVNQVSSGFNNGASLWGYWDSLYFLVPKNGYSSNIKSFLYGGIWMGGFDPGGDLRIAASTYGASAGNNDYWSGPVVMESTMKERCENWDRFFTVKKSEIEIHRNQAFQFNLFNLHYPEYLIPESIKAWPAKGNPYFENSNGFPMEGGPFTDFFDKNGNGIYEPAKGDYPAIIQKSGEPLVPDEMVFWVFNDVGGIHTESQGDAIGAEVHAIAYAFNEPGYLDYSQFYRYKVINKSGERLEKFRFGLWIDPEINCYHQTMSGCDSTQSIAFYYLPDIGIPCPPFSPNKDTLPMLGIDFLGVNLSNGNYTQRPMESFTYIENPSVGNPPPAITDPQTAIEFYNYLNGLNRGGYPMENNGTYSSFAYPSSPDCTDTLNCWSMCLENKIPIVRRTIQSTGDIYLDPMEYAEIHFATLYNGDVEYPCPGTSGLLEVSDEIQDLFDSGFEPLLLSEENREEKAQVEVFPNPVQLSGGNLKFKNLPPKSRIEIYDLDGREVWKINSIGNSSLQLIPSGIFPKNGLYVIKIVSPSFDYQFLKLIVI